MFEFDESKKGFLKMSGRRVADVVEDVNGNSF